MFQPVIISFQKHQNYCFVGVTIKKQNRSLCFTPSREPVFKSCIRMQYFFVQTTGIFRINNCRLSGYSVRIKLNSSFPNGKPAGFEKPAPIKKILNISSS